MRLCTRIRVVFLSSFVRIVSILSIIFYKRAVPCGDVCLRVVHSLISLLQRYLLMLVDRLTLSSLVFRLHVVRDILLTARD